MAWEPVDQNGNPLVNTPGLPQNIEGSASYFLSDGSTVFSGALTGEATPTGAYLDIQNYWLGLDAMGQYNNSNWLGMFSPNIVNVGWLYGVGNPPNPAFQVAVYGGETQNSGVLYGLNGGVFPYGPNGANSARKRASIPPERAQ